jgi:hypothetical protein
MFAATFGMAGLIDYVKSCGNRAVREVEYALERYFSDSEAVCERFRKTPRLKPIRAMLSALSIIPVGSISWRKVTWRQVLEHVTRCPELRFIKAKIHFDISLLGAPRWRQ